MGFKREHLEKWAVTATPGEQLVSYAVTSQRGATSAASVNAGSTNVSVGAEARVALARRLGLDEAKQISSATETFYLLTDRRLVLGSRSSVRNRPKELVHAAPQGDVRVWWFDADTGAGNRFRHFIVDFGDGHWRGDHSGLTALGRELRSGNTDEFIEALGERATHTEQ